MPDQSAEHLRRTHVPPGRDMTIYTRYMDAALEAKVQSMVRYFGDIPEGAQIVDVGSGTGQVAESIAREYHNMGARVFAVDSSHDLLDIADSNRCVISIIYADATSLKPIPDSSVHVMMHGTIGHEINSFSGIEGLKSTLSSAFAKLAPGGLEVWRDFAKPAYEGAVLMKISESGGVDNQSEATRDGFLDYSLLSTRALFDCFYNEFMGGKAFEYSTVTREGQEYIQLPARFAHEFCLRKDYTANWRQEIHEQYLYWAPHQGKAAFEDAGFIDVSVHRDDNEYIRTHRLRGKISLYQETEAGMEEVEFLTHMVITARKPTDAGRETSQSIPEVDYHALIGTIFIDEAVGEARIGDKVFKIRQRVGTGSHKRGYLLDSGKEVIKIVRADRPNLHNIFKSMQQMVERQPILDEYHVPYMPITGSDSEGPPYRYVMQEKVPEGSICAAQLILQHSLTEEDVRQMAEIINAFELSKKWQIDTNPYNWFRVKGADGKSKMTYVGGTVFMYDEMWDFKKIGLLQWTKSAFIQESELMSSIVPKAQDADSFAKEWKASSHPVIMWWKKYLSATVQPS